jgi:hypothetical protein
VADTQSVNILGLQFITSFIIQADVTAGNLTFQMALSRLEVLQPLLHTGRAQTIGDSIDQAVQPPISIG